MKKILNFAIAVISVLSIFSTDADAQLARRMIMAASALPDITGQGTVGQAQTTTFEISSTFGVNAGLKFTADQTGSVYQSLWSVSAVNSAGDFHVEVWSDSAGSPSAQIGGDSSTVNISTGGQKTFTWATNKPVLIDGTVYWLVLVMNTFAAANISLNACNAVAGFLTSRNNTITSLGAEINPSYDWIAGY